MDGVREEKKPTYSDILQGLRRPSSNGNKEIEIEKDRVHPTSFTSLSR